MTESLSRFNCGIYDFNTFICDDYANKHPVPYCYVDTDNNKIVAYLSINCSGIIHNSTEDNGFGYQPPALLMSAIEIKYFAVDVDYQNLLFCEKSTKYETLSHEMFMNVIDQLIKLARNRIGAQAIVLYSTPRARNFYLNCGFLGFAQEMKRTQDEDSDVLTDNCYPMYMLLPSLYR